MHKQIIARLEQMNDNKLNLDAIQALGDDLWLLLNLNPCAKSGLYWQIYLEVLVDNTEQNWYNGQ